MLIEKDGPQHRAVLHSPPDDVDAVHHLLRQVWADNPQIEELERLRFETALVELSGNVFEHADDGRGLECRLAVTVCSDRLTAVVEDTGAPLRGDIHPKGMPGAFAESGRGLALIHALVDDLTYVRDDETNRWRIVRNLHAADDGCGKP